MNYYEHHIGDFLKKTAHLSIVEEGVYRRLLDRYYIVEGPLPVDVRECCKLARAASRSERAAVADVLREFFDLRDDGWHQTRADEEIARYQDKQAKAKRSAEARWSAQRSECERMSEGNANASTDAMRTHMRTHSEGNAPRARPQTPDTRHQTPEESAARSSRAPAHEQPPSPTIAGQACRLMREAGIPRVNPSDPRLLQLLSQGVTPQQLGDLASELVQAGNSPETATYVLRAMEGRLKAAASMPQHPDGTAQRIGNRSSAPTRQDRISATVAELTGRTRHQSEIIDVVATERTPAD